MFLSASQKKVCSAKQNRRFAGLTACRTESCSLPMSVTVTCADAGTLSLQRTTMLTLLLRFYTNKHSCLISFKHLQAVVGAGRTPLPVVTGATGPQGQQHALLQRGELNSWSRPPAEKTEGCDGAPFIWYLEDWNSLKAELLTILKTTQHMEAIL